MEKERVSTSPPGSMTARQLEKLELEIHSLRNSISWLARLLPLITIIAAFLSFGFGIYQMRKGFDNSIAISEKEFRRKFYEEQFAGYLELSEITASLSTLEESKLQEESRHLLNLRYGKLIILAEDQRLLAQIDRFIEVLNRYNSKLATRDELESAARVLAATCRNSVVRFWQIPIPGDIKQFSSLF
jgi:hypothetical protein